MKGVSASRQLWYVVTVALGLMSLFSMWGPASESTWEHPVLLLVLVSGSATVCIIAATLVIALADSRQLAELGLLGSALMAASVMPLVRGLVTPGVLYDDTPAFEVATFLTLPIAVAVAAPLLSPHSGFGRWAARHWREWTLLSLFGVFVIASLVVFYPDAISAPDPTSPVTVAVCVAMVIAFGMISLRQLRYFELGRRRASLAASMALMLISLSGLLPLSTTMYSLGFWWLTIAGIIGVAGACAGLGLSKQVGQSTQEALGPVLLRDPLAAFELGLSPVVHRFVADLDSKDVVTRDHVVRTAEMAIRVGERFQMSARDLRDLGLAALLHDVGKLNIPIDVLNKPGRLTADEYELVKQHAVDGQQMLLNEPSLASVAPIVRSHHERIDGRGYPDGLSGKEIPLASRIIAACDALDAMTHDREYRAALSIRIALAVLREHAGSQWDAAVIEQVIAVLPSMAGVGALDAVGRSDDTSVPDDIGELLVAVDAEI